VIAVVSGWRQSRSYCKVSRPITAETEGGTAIVTPAGKLPVLDFQGAEQAAVIERQNRRRGNPSIEVVRSSRLVLPSDAHSPLDSSQIAELFSGLPYALCS
jgi:hypothetical protein